MPKFTKIQTNFTTGEVAQAVWGRIDSDRYDGSLQTCLNYIPTLQGPLIRRPGSRYIGNVKDSTQPGYLFEFQVSATVGYILEFGDKYIRFWTNDGQALASSTVFSIRGTWGPSPVQFETFLPFFALSYTNVGNPQHATTNASTINSGSVLELVTPYAYADIPGLRISQDGPVAYLTHPNYPPFKLTRVGGDIWFLDQMNLQDGPFLPLNSYATIADSARINLVPSQSSVASIAAFPNVYNLSTGSSYSIASAGSISGSGSNTILQLLSAPSYQVGDRVFVSNVVMTGSAFATINNFTTTNSSAPAYWSVTNIQGSSVTLNFTNWSGTMAGSTGNIFPALFQVTPGKNPSLGADGLTAWQDAGIPIASLPQPYLAGRTIGLVNNGTRYPGNLTLIVDAAHAVVQLNNGFILPNTSAVSIWSMGVYNQATGFPQTSCLHQNRLFLAGAPGASQQFDGSFLGNYELFSASGSNFQVTDQNAISFKLVSPQVQPIYWMKPTAQGLLAGTLSGEWQISPSSLAGGLTPTNVTAQQLASFGASNIDSVVIGNNVLYTQKAQRKIRELNYFFNAGTYRSTNISELAEHLTLPFVTKLAVQKEINPLIWGLRGDGQLISLSYSRDDIQVKAGWARHVLGGQSDSAGSPPVIKSIGVVTASSGFYDQLWMTVQRSIAGSSVVTIENLTRPFDYTTPQEDAFYVDCGGSYDQPLSVSAISKASSCVVTVPGHGFTASTTVRFYQAVGLNSSVVDANGNPSITNLVNQQTFVVASVSVNAFKIQDFLGNDISSLNYTSYLGSSVVRKLVSTVTGATWLSGETISALGDGGILNNSTVSAAGNFPLSFPAAKVALGYSYNSDFQLLRTHDGSAQGTSIGSTRRVNRVALMFHNLAEIGIGATFTSLLPAEFARAEVLSADNPVLISDGIIRENISAPYTFDDYICFRQQAPLPGMIQSVVRFLEEFDV